MKINDQRYQVNNFKILLKDFEPIVKGGDLKGRHWLINGNNLKKKPDIMSVDDGSTFNMRYREAWANWLLCVVLRKIYKQDITFQEPKHKSEADGVIFNKNTNKKFFVEHVSAMDYPYIKKLPAGEDRILCAINKKIKKGSQYAKGKSLVVFVDGTGIWYPNKVGRIIPANQPFEAIFCGALIEGGETGYSYSVTEFSKFHSLMFRVNINSDFTDFE